MRTHQVAIGDLITAINGLPVMGCDTLLIANVLQALPACVTLRLTKYGAQYLQDLAMRQVNTILKKEKKNDALMLLGCRQSWLPYGQSWWFCFECFVHV